MRARASRSRTYGVARRAHQFRWRAELLEPPAAQHGNAIREQECLVEVVRDEHARHRPRRAGHTQRPKAVLQIRARDGIEGAEWLVEKQQRRLGGQRPRDRDALSLST